MIKLKHIFTLVCVLLLVPAMLSVTACKKTEEAAPSVDELVAQNGFRISGDGLDKDVEFIVQEITDENRKEELQIPLSPLTYDKDAGVAIYKLELEKDGTHFHINTPLTISLSAPMEHIQNYIVFHIKENGSIATIFPSLQSDGTLSFEIKSMGYLIFSKILPASEISHQVKLFTVVEGDSAIATLNRGQNVVFSTNTATVLGKKDAFTTVLYEGETDSFSAACESDNVKFVGWFRVLSEDKKSTEGDRLSRLKLEDKPFSTDLKVDFKYDSLIESGKSESTYCAVWKVKRTFVVDMESLLPKNADGKYVYHSSDPKPNFEGLVARSTNLSTMEGSFLYFGKDYTIEKNNLDLTTAGEYTVTYVFNADPSLRVSFRIVVVESPVLTVKSGEGGSVIYQDRVCEADIVDVLKTGTEVSFIAHPSKNYRFIGWYDGDKLLSSALIYSFAITESTTITPKFEAWNPNKIEFGIQSENNADATILKDGSIVANSSGNLSHIESLREGEKVTLTAATTNENLKFAGWYIKSGDGTTSSLVSTNATYTFVATDAGASYYALFKAKHELRVEIKAEDLRLTYSEESGRYLYQMGDQAPAFENVKAETVNLLTGEVTTLEYDLGYLVDASDFNTEKAGVYTVYYVCFQDPSATFSIQVEVVAKTA